MGDIVKPPIPPSQTQVPARPAGFLTLPRELRQKILLLSLDEASKDDVMFNMLLRRLSDIIPNLSSTPRRPRPPISAPHIMTWASALHSVDPSVCEDLPFVIEKCLSRFESLAAGIGPSRAPTFRWLKLLALMDLPYKYVLLHGMVKGWKKIRMAIGYEA
ncbi:hypothetical protein Vi05172_g3358 [Venturia inaequalis]|nr:hypothetical protein Vi05172_g3358 [Venturia inaequalis]